MVKLILASQLEVIYCSLADTYHFTEHGACPPWGLFRSAFSPSEQKERRTNNIKEEDWGEKEQNRI